MAENYEKSETNLTARFIDKWLTCSNCKNSLRDIMDADSYFAIGFDGTPYCPWCGAKMENYYEN